MTPDTADLSVQSLKQWTKAVNVYGATLNVAHVERLARACHVACEAVRTHRVGSNEHAEAENLLHATQRAVGSLKLPSKLFLNSDNRPLAAEDRLRAFSQQKDTGPRAIDLDEADCPSPAQQTFYPVPMFALTLAMAAARTLTGPASATPTAAVERLLSELVSTLRKLIALPCSGARLVNLALGAVDLLGEADRGVWMKHLDHCQEPRHRERLLALLPAAAQRHWISLPDCYARILEAAPHVSDGGLWHLGEKLVLLDDIPGTLIALLKLADLTRQSESHRNLMEALRDYLRDASLDPDAWALGLGEQLHHLVADSTAFAPRRPYHPDDIANSLMAISNLSFSLWRRQRLLPRIESMPGAARGLAEILNAGMQANDRIPKLLRRWDSRLMDQLLAELQRMELTTESRALLDQILRQRAAEPQSQEIEADRMPGWLLSTYLSTYDPDTFFRTAWPGWTDQRCKHLQTLHQALRQNKSSEETRRTAWQMGSLMQYMGQQLHGREFWPTFARRHCLIEAHALWSRAGESERPNGPPPFTLDADRLQNDLQTLAQAYYDSDQAIQPPHSLSLESDLRWQGEAALPLAYPRLLRGPSGYMLQRLTDLARSGSRDDVLDFCGELWMKPIPERLRESPVESLLHWFAVLLDDSPPPRTPVTGTTAGEPALGRMLAASIGRPAGSPLRPLSPDAAAPALLEHLVRLLVRAFPATKWLGPQVRDLGELMALLRRDPGLGARWHSHPTNPLYRDFAREPSASLITLARMSHLIASTGWPAGDEVDGIPCGALERSLLAALRGALCELASQYPGQGEPFAGYLRSRYVLEVTTLHQYTQLPLSNFRREVFFPARFLPLLSPGNDYSLLHHVRSNPDQLPTLQPDEDRVETTGGLRRYAFWFYGSTRWNGTVKSLPAIVADLSVNRHRIMKLWLDMRVVERAADVPTVLDAHTGGPSRLDDLPLSARQAFSQLPRGYVAYYFSLAMHSPDSVEDIYSKLRGTLRSNP